MLRAIAILLGIAVTRPVMGIFFRDQPTDASSTKTVFRGSFLDWFSTSTLVGEFWLRGTPF